jgi:hypothetical protein
MTGIDLSLVYTDPAAFVTAVADGATREASDISLGIGRYGGVTPGDSAQLVDILLAEADLWRGVVRRHRGFRPTFETSGPSPRCSWCMTHPDERIAWPCPDLLAVVAAARAYLGGAS